MTHGRAIATHDDCEARPCPCEGTHGIECRDASFGRVFRTASGTRPDNICRLHQGTVARRRPDRSHLSSSRGGVEGHAPEWSAGLPIVADGPPPLRMPSCFLGTCDGASVGKKTAGVEPGPRETYSSSAVGVLGRPRLRPLCRLGTPQAAGAGRRSSQSVVRAGELSCTEYRVSALWRRGKPAAHLPHEIHQTANLPSVTNTGSGMRHRLCIPTSRGRSCSYRPALVTNGFASDTRRATSSLRPISSVRCFAPIRAGNGFAPSWTDRKPDGGSICNETSATRRNCGSSIFGEAK